MEHLAVAVAESHAGEFDASVDPSRKHGIRGLGDGRLGVENLEDPFGTGRRPLRGRHHADHRFHAAVEAGDVRHEGGQRADGEAATEDEPGPGCPDDERAEFGGEAHERTEERPVDVHPIVRRDHAGVGRGEPLLLATLLGERLHDTDARYRVGQQAREVSPGHARLREAAAHAFAHRVDEPDDEREGEERHDGEPRMDHHQHHGRERYEEHVGGEIDEVKREEVVDAVGVVADPGDEISSAAGGEEVE